MDQILTFDANLSKRLRLAPGQHRLWLVIVFFAHSGDSWFLLAGLGLTWLLSWPLSLTTWRGQSVLLAIGIVILAILVLGIKFTIKRQRPPGEWGAIYRNTDPHSFPSGHAARSFMLAVMVLSLGPVWLGFLLFLWAPLVCLARVSTGVHYVSDVVAGMFLGLLAGWVMLLAQPLIFSIQKSILPFLI